MPKRRVALYALLIAITAALSITAYVGLSRWPTGAAVGGPLRATTQPLSKTSIRIATFNMHSGIGADGKFDLDRTADTLKDCDLIGLNEVRGGFSSDQATLLGQKLSLTSLFAPNERTLFHDDFGNGLLSRLQIDGCERIPMPGSQAAHHRNVLIVHTRIGGGPIVVMIAHVARGPDRLDQLQFLFSLFSSLKEPAVLIGDLNTERSDPALANFLKVSVDAVGQPSDDPHRIDWIFTRGLHVAAAGAANLQASDHPLVWADVTRPQE